MTFNNVSTTACLEFEALGRGVVTPNDGLCADALPKRGAVFRLEVKKGGNS